MSGSIERHAILVSQQGVRVKRDVYMLVPTCLHAYNGRMKKPIRGLMNLRMGVCELRDIKRAAGDMPVTTWIRTVAVAKARREIAKRERERGQR